MTRGRREEFFNKLSNPDYLAVFNNLTPYGFQRGLSKIRKKDPSLARQIERFLEPYLKEHNIFPRRKIPWFKTSEGTRLRLALLSKNPYVKQDIEQVRQFLGIHEVRLDADDLDIVRQKPAGKKEIDERKVIEATLVGQWVYAHRYTAAGHDVFDEPKMEWLLPEEIIKTAATSAKANLASPESPAWLRLSAHSIPCDTTSISPIDMAAARMTERHRLPYHVKFTLIAYLLTLNEEWVTKLELLLPQSEYNDVPSSDPEAFSITIRGIDEFITASDWNHIWKAYVVPRQKHLWELRGMNPQGRRFKDIKRFEDMMELYTKKVRENLSMQKTIFSSDSPSLRNLDQETIRGRIKDLDDLLSPLP